MQYSGQHVPRDSWLKNLPHVKDSLHIYEILLLSGFAHYGFPELYMIVFLSINVLLLKIWTKISISRLNGSHEIRFDVSSCMLLC